MFGFATWTVCLVDCVVLLGTERVCGFGGCCGLVEPAVAGWLVLHGLMVVALTN